MGLTGFAGIAVALACLPVLGQATAQPKAVSHSQAKAKGANHYVVPIQAGPEAARPGRPGKSFEMTEIKTSAKPGVKRRHRRVHRKDRFSYMRETIRQAARKQ